MEEYFAAKRVLFTDLAPAHAVVNVDDPYGRAAGRRARRPRSPSRSSATRPTAPTDDRDRARRLAVHGRRRPTASSSCSSPLRGRFNVYNVLGAFAAARALGVAGRTAIEAIATAGQVPGRFESVERGPGLRGARRLRAHPGLARERAAGAARRSPAARLHVVFGCGGDRDRGKRPLMGEIAARLADRVIVTSDNPRSEDPEAIIDEILAGTGPAVEHDVDRRRRIAAGHRRRPTRVTWW